MQVRTYMDVMKEQHLSKEEVNIIESFVFSRKMEDVVVKLLGLFNN